MHQENIHYQHTQTSIALYCYAITVLYKYGKTAHNQCQDCRSNSINMYMRLLLSSNGIVKKLLIFNIAVIPVSEELLH